jgi:hypothetical protein
MKNIILLLVCCFYFCGLSAGQKHAPRNIQQAVKILEKEFPDSLKPLLFTAEAKNLYRIVYPFYSNYRRLYDWDDTENSSLNNYLEKRNIFSNQTNVVLAALRVKLKDGQYNEDTLLYPFQQEELKIRKEDLVRFTTDTLRGRYIPKDLDDCFTQLDHFYSDSVKNEFCSMSTREFTSISHLGLGTWMRNNWQLWAGSRLWKYFSTMGVTDPEAISGLILEGYHCKLTGKAFSVDSQVAIIKREAQEYITKNELEQKERFDGYALGDTVEYNYPYGFISDAQDSLNTNMICTAKGIIEQRTDSTHFIKIKLISSCGKRIRIYDSDQTKVYDPKTKQWSKSRKRKVNYLFPGHSAWFNFRDWTKQE